MLTIVAYIDRMAVSNRQRLDRNYVRILIIKNITLGMLLSVLTLPFLAVVFSLFSSLGLGWGSWSQLWTALSAVGTVSAFVTAAVVYRKNIEAEHSKVLLGKVIEGFSLAYEALCSDKESVPNNDRVRWIRAARLLVEAQNLAEGPGGITSARYLKAYELDKDRWRFKFYQLLGDADPVYESLRPAFFYGVKKWASDNIDPDEAARLSSSKIEAYSMAAYEPWKKMNSLNSLSPQSIIPIYDFCQYPADYKDPLDLVKSWEIQNIRHETGNLSGPINYLRHQNDHVIFDGMCYRSDDLAAKKSEHIRRHGEYVAADILRND
mgnify:CR=1 FL=1